MWRWVLGLIRQRKDYKIVLISTSVYMVDKSPQNGSCQYLCSQGELQLPPVSLGDSPSSADRSDPGSFQINFCSVPRAYEILCVPFTSRIFIFHSPLSLPNVSPGDLQSQTSQGFIFLVQDHWAGVHDVGLRPLPLWENLCSYHYSFICGTPTCGYVT